MMTRIRDCAATWLRFMALVALIASNGIQEESRIQAAEAGMFLRWMRDVIRYDLRWMIQEKLRLVARRAMAVRGNR